MRLGGPVFRKFDGDFDAWADAVRAEGYSAAFCPLSLDADGAAVRACRDAASRADILIAEVGAWSNPISPDESVRKAAIEKCKLALALADSVGAACCVNIAGSRGAQWDGPHPDNLSRDTFDLIVGSVREIIDAVRPARAFYTLETMPWVLPDSPDSYRRLIRAIGRRAFGVHLDPVNLVNSPRRIYRTGLLLRRCFRMLGPHIKSCHAKDIAISGKLTLHLDEVRPGLGMLDYRTYLSELDRLGDVPLMIEHLPNESECRLAAAYIRSVAREVNVPL
jgi:sugar phosphate isomerase/epimerase